MSKTIIVRIIVPNEADSGKIIGHYDMQVVTDSSLPLHFHGVEDSNLVFSYGPNGVYVFPGNQSKAIYESYRSEYARCDVYKCSLTVSDSQFQLFINALEGENGIDTTPRDLDKFGGISFPVVPGSPFAKYKVKDTNCFRAVAVWLNLMGIDTLLKIYDQAHDPNCDYLKYSAGRMVQKFASNPAWYKAASV